MEETVRKRIPFMSPTRSSLASRISKTTSAAGGLPRIENHSPARHHQYYGYDIKQIWFCLAICSDIIWMERKWEKNIRLGRKLSSSTTRKITIFHTILSINLGMKIIKFLSPKCDRITSWRLTGFVRSHYVFHELLHVDFDHVWLQPYPKTKRFRC